MKELIIEIGVEELPAIPFLKELPNIEAKWQAVLEEYRLVAPFKFYFTPRRLTLWHEGFPEKQDDASVEFVGAPRAVAMKDGAWTQAALSFAKKCGIKPDELKFENLNGKETLYYKKPVVGEASKELIGDMIEKFLLSLNFGKSMRWGDGEFSFIRPIRSLLAILGGEVLKFSKFGVCSNNDIFAHRSISYDKFSVKDARDYFASLDRLGIILDANKRREKILEEFKQIEAKSGLNIEIDEDLLDEVVAITEYPTALLGEFEEEFLELPSEVIITSMKENQRYFPLFKEGKLSNHFVVVSNAIAPEYSLIVKGNQKVLRARLSDAMFFWRSDLSAEFSAQKLKNITYLKELGSIYDKQTRELKVAKYLAALFADRLKSEVGSEYEALIVRAVELSKADLTTQMVYEFTELQGVMGAYYAAARGENEAVVRAIREQYLPTGENSRCPSGVFSSIIALSAKFDTLMGLFSVGKIPSGNKDPYALRRAANGIIKIAMSENLRFDLRALLTALSGGYAKFDIALLEGFIFDRLYTFFAVNPSIVKACLSSEKNDILAQCEAITALAKVSEASDFRENFSTFKRLANIVKDETIAPIDERLMQNDSERELNAKFKAVVEKEASYEQRLADLFALKGAIDSFFDNVMINVDDAQIRANRTAIVGQIYKEFLKIADIKEISL